MAVKTTGSAATQSATKPADSAATVDPGAAPANIPAATEFDPSGAPVQIVPDVDPSHPAVDNDPRKDTSLDQNRIDFNDPTKSMEEAVEENLEAQSKD